MYRPVHDLPLPVRCALEARQSLSVFVNALRPLDLRSQRPHRHASGRSRPSARPWRRSLATPQQVIEPRWRSGTASCLGEPPFRIGTADARHGPASSDNDQKNDSPPLILHKLAANIFIKWSIFDWPVNFPRLNFPMHCFHVVFQIWHGDCSHLIDATSRS